MNENIDDLFEELTKEQKQAKLAEWSCKMDVLTVMLKAIEDDLEKIDCRINLSSESLMNLKMSLVI
ncbi:hypothetical protein [Ligilactobacillus salivarius]|uniref:hypothetical protein n=1 Tax=Ligilactobacillus salivarius TaxID=1624 RepID=UPI001F512259|nr:hypothetical protein [Ligilactobacillus salivarius]